MYFGLSEEQEFFQETISRYLEGESTIDAIRNFTHGNNSDFPESIHSGLLELGINGLIIPEEYGGLEQDLLSAAAVSETLGAGVAISPFIGSYVMAPYAIIKAGSETQRDKYLKGIVEGSVRFGVGLYAGGNQDLSGEPLGTGDYNGSLRLDYAKPLANGMVLFAGLDYNFFDDYRLTGDLDPIDIQEANARVNARIGISKGNLTALIYGRNLSDETIATGGFDTPLLGGGHSYYMGEFKTVGARLTYQF